VRVDGELLASSDDRNEEACGLVWVLRVVGATYQKGQPKMDPVRSSAVQVSFKPANDTVRNLVELLVAVDVYACFHPHRVTDSHKRRTFVPLKGEL
jgi:hypothetical protein